MVTTLISTVPHSYSGCTIVEYLSRRFTYHSVDEWNDLVINQNILLNGEVCPVDRTVANKDSVTYNLEAYTEPVANLNYSIIYEDEWILAVDKPTNLLVHRAGKAFTHNLVYQLRTVRPGGNEDIQIVNRLDRETSGIVLCAKSSAIAQKFGELFSGRNADKMYIALVNGIPDPATMRIDKPIGKDTGSAFSYKFCIDAGAGKESVTDLELISAVGTAHALIFARPQTGRTHQIRVHCASIGHPIVGDRLYSLSEEEYTSIQAGSATELFADRLLMDRQALHCCQLSFVHPFTQQPIQIAAPIASDILACIKNLDSQVVIPV